MPIKTQKVIDAKPRLSATLESDKSLFSGTVQRRHLALQRGTSGGILRVGYGEVGELINLLTEAKQFLEDHDEDTHASLEDGYTAPEQLNVPENPRGPNSRTQPKVETAATLGTGAEQPAEATGHIDNSAPGADTSGAVPEPGASETDIRQPGPVATDNPFATA